MCQCLNKLLIFLASFSVYFVSSFNVDSVNYAAFSGPDGSMFGFSMAFHKRLGHSWLIVGAPEAQSSFQPGVYRGGVVYQCPTDSNARCLEIPFDREGNNRNADYEWDNKTEQWFGATVSSSGTENGRIVACAPRYTWHPKTNRRDPVGTCYVSDETLTQFNEYAPCRTFQWGYHRQGSCQAGLSAAVNTKNDRLFVGAPGSCYWQGEMYSIDANEKFKFKPDKFNATFGDKGQVHHQSLDSRPVVFATAPRKQDYDNTYMGYSVITGNFFNSSEDGVAIGIPRDNGLRGNVRITTWNLTTEFDSFSSDQVGSYFGYALAACDVDGDGAVDLIVGAPMYTVANNKGKYDDGRVYVFYQRSAKGRFVAKAWIDGFNSKSRFGQALASLGDINLDGYGDFAVGAPYDGPHNAGAVYIYHGSSEGIRKKYSQVIYAEDIAANGPAISTFGFSITGGLDLDENDYPDMAVGAYLSNKAYFFRSRPVVRVEAGVNFLTPRKEVDIKFADYVLQSGKKAVRTKIDFCIKYTGRGIPNYIDLDLQYILDTKKASHPRMGFIGLENSNTLNDTIRLTKDDSDRCILKEVFVFSEVRDKLTSLSAEVKYWMREEPNYSHISDRNSVLKPILDLNSPPSRVDSISIHKECGSDNVCTPNLQLTVTPNVRKYLLGSSEHLYLDVVVANVDEDSYESTIEVTFPEAVYYVNVIEEKVESRILCNTNNQTLKCEIGNPIPKDKVVHFKIKWQPTYAELKQNSYDFNITVNSTNPENPNTLSDNKQKVSVEIFSSSTLEVRGKSIPAEVFVNATSSKVDFANAKNSVESDIGPQVFHEYYLRNEGPTTIEEAEMFFTFPAQTQSGEDFIYLLEHFSSNPKVKCDNYYPNYRAFKLEFNRKLIWEKLNLEVKEDQVHSVVGGGRPQTDDMNDRDNSHMISSGTASNGEFTTTVSKNEKFENNGYTHLQTSNSTHFRNNSGLYVSSTGELVSVYGTPQVGESSQQGSESYWHQAHKQGGGGTWQQAGGSSSTGQQGGQGQGSEWSQGGGTWQQGGAGAGSTLGQGQNSSWTQSGSGSSAQDNNWQHGTSGTSQGQGSEWSQGGGSWQQGGAGAGSTSGQGQNSSWTQSGSGSSAQDNNWQHGTSQGQGSNWSQGVGEGAATSQEQNSSWNQAGSGSSWHGGSSSSGQAGGSWGQGGLYANQSAGAGGKITTIMRCFNELNGQKHEVSCGSDEFASINMTNYNPQNGAMVHTGKSTVTVYRECFQTINGVQRKTVCPALNQTVSGSSTGNAAGQVQTSVDEYQQKLEYERRVEEYHRQEQQRLNEEQRIKAENERKEYEKKRQEQERRQQEEVRRQEEERRRGSGSQTGVEWQANQEKVRIELERKRYEEERRQREEAVKLEEERRRGSGSTGEEWRLSEERRRNEERARAEMERVRLEQERRHQEATRREEEQRYGSAYWRVSEEKHIKEEKERIETEKRRQEEEHRRQEDERRRQEVLRREEDRKRQEVIRKQQEERQRYDEEERRQQEIRRNQGGSSHDEYYGESYEDSDQYGGQSSHTQEQQSSNNGRVNQDTAIGAVIGNQNGNKLTVSTLDLGDLGLQSGRASSESGRVASGGSGDRRGEWSESGHWSESGQIPPTYFNTLERDNVATDRPSNKNRLYGRKKRDVGEAKPQCKTMKCKTIRCTVVNLGDKEDVTFVFRSRVNSRVIKSISNSESLKFSSLMEARINRLPYIGKPVEQVPYSSETFTTVSSSETKLKPDIVPLWIIVLSAVAGILILLLIILCCSKLGFFNRNRREDTAETQPLQSNGYHDDAHL